MRDSPLASTNRPASILKRLHTDEKDVKIVVDVLRKAKVFEVIEELSHRMFPKFTQDQLHKLNREQMVKEDG